MNATKINTLVLGLLAGATAGYASTDYGPAIWRPTCSGHWYSSGYGHKFDVCHCMDGYYLSSISFLASCSTPASVHYCVNGLTDSSDGGAAPGEVTQMVRESLYAWHATCWNLYSFGTEHEGFESNPAWYTEAQYQASAHIQRHICDSWGIAKDRNHIVGHNEKSSGAWCSYASSNFGIDPYCNTHSDPGPYWKWSHFMDLIKQTPVVSYAKVQFGPVGINKNGAEEVFVVGAGNGHVWHQWQTGPNGPGWSSAYDMGGTITFKPGVLAENNGTGRLEIFALGTDSCVYHNWQQEDMSWAGWNKLGTWQFSKIATAANDNGCLEVFGIGMDKNLYHMYQSPGGGWNGWYQMGSTLAVKDVSAMRNYDDRLEVFVVTTGGSISHMWQTAPYSGWSDWASMGGANNSKVVAARNGKGWIEVFTLVNGVVFHRWQTSTSGGWADAWYSLGGANVTQLTVGANPDGRLEVFGRVSDTSTWHIWQTASAGGWSSWANLAGSDSSIAVSCNDNGRLELFGIGTATSHLFHIWQTTIGNSTSWTGSWSDMGGNWSNLQ